MKVVNVEDKQFRLTVSVEVANGNGCALISPRDPVRNFLPITPSAGDVSLSIEFVANAEAPHIRSWFAMFYLKNHQTQAIGTKIRHSDPGALIFSGGPLRNLNPGAPVSSNVRLSIESFPNSIKGAVRTRSGMIHAQNDQLW